MRRIMKLLAGGGLSITGAHDMCGDYLYSGHTVMLTLTYLFIKECKFTIFFNARLEMYVSRVNLSSLPLSLGHELPNKGGSPRTLCQLCSSLVEVL